MAQAEGNSEEHMDNMRQQETEKDVDGNPQSLTCQLLNQLKFSFDEVQTGSDVTQEGPCECNGPVGIKHGVAESFADPLE